MIMFLCIISIFFLCGCGNAENIPSSESRPALRRVLGKIDEMPQMLRKGNFVGLAYFNELKVWVDELCPEERIVAFEKISKALSIPVFNKRPISDRQSALDAYLDTLEHITKVFSEEIPDSDSVWRLALRIYDLLDQEKVAACDDDFDRYNPSLGIITTREMYIAHLDYLRFMMTRHVFEDDRFGTYFHTLAKSRQSEWQNILIKVAAREVCIYDPRSPRKKKPRFQFVTPVYGPPNHTNSTTNNSAPGVWQIGA